MFFFTRLLGRRGRKNSLHEVSLARQVRFSAVIVVTLLLLHIQLITMTEGDCDSGLICHTNNLGYEDATWLTLTTVFTVGYGDISAHTLAGRASTVFLVYFGSIFVLAQLAGMAFDLRQFRRTSKLRGLWRWDMKDHILIVNAPRRGAETYLHRLVQQLRADPEYKESPIQILSPEFPDGLSEDLRAMGVVHRTGTPHVSEDLESVNIRDATHVILLAPDELDPRSDSLNFDVLHRMRELYTGARILVEAVDDSSRDRFRRFGAHTILRPMRTYPELLVRAMAAPGTEEVFEEMLLPSGSLTRRYNLKVAGIRWSEIVTALMEAEVGTALAYVHRESGIVTNPDANAVVHAHGLIVLMRPGAAIPRAVVMDILERLPAATGAR